MEELISVIMPAYNRQESIAFSIESVLNQSYRNFELILVDDSSEDATYDIMSFYAYTDKRVRIVRNQTNSRNSLIEWEPRNDGLKTARGSLIAYLDSDNLWNPEFLKICSAPFVVDPNLRIVHCNSRNHYRDVDQFKLVIDNDNRELVLSDEEELTTVYSYKRAWREESGLSWYIDTNEMMHKTEVFRDLEYLWATRHHNRQKINESQLVRCTYRRHNDQELAERIIARYGISSLYKLDDVLVDFFYAPRQGKYLKLKYEKEISLIMNQLTSQCDISHRNDLNIDLFYKDYLIAEDTSTTFWDFGVGELNGEFSNLILNAFKIYSESPRVLNSLIKYRGTASHIDALHSIADKLREGGLNNIDEFSIIPCDGGHNAIFHSLCSFSNSLKGSESRSRICFMVPSYPYWTLCTAVGYDYEAIEAYSFDSFIEKLSKTIDNSVAAIIINTPHNPLGLAITLKEVEHLNDLARRYNCRIIVDIPYYSFTDVSSPLSIINKFDEDLTVYCDSASKSLAIPGLRLGFAITKNKELAAFIRAHKSASSLLPSSIKLGFLELLISSYPNITEMIVKNVLQKRKLVEKYFQSKPLPFGLVWIQREFATIYDIVYIQNNSELGKISQEELIRKLREEHNIIIIGEKQFFPPSFLRKSKSDKMLRLSFGKIEDISNSLDAFLNALQNIIYKLKN